MSKVTKEEQKIIAEKLKKVKLDLNAVPSIFNYEEKISYKPLQEYDNTNYKIYNYVDIKDIEIYLTPCTRLEETNQKYKLAEPLINYLQPNNEELSQNYKEFTNMLKDLDIDKLKQVEEEQKLFQKQLPYEVKYKENFIWGIYYSPIEDKYFMMFPTHENQTEALFYLIKKQIESQKSKKKEMIYVPINNMEYTSGILKKSEIADLENYLWYFTKEWPTIYEIKKQDKTKEIQVIGNVEVYEKLKSTYKISFASKEEAAKYFKLIKALFILKSNAEEEYQFKTSIGENGDLCFYFNHNEITYDNLSDFIKNEVQNKKEKFEKLVNENLKNVEKLEVLKEIIAKQNAEYLSKEKQIVTFLECKKSFFGKLSYFFKSKKKKKQEFTVPKKEHKEQEHEKISKEDFVQKDLYTIEDLLKICTKLQEQEKEFKNKEMDIKALENKRENLDRKIKNATIYINEIESHKKSIFDFWKFTNKDEVPLLNEAEEEEKNQNKEKLRKVFSFEDDIEQVGKKIDISQRNIFIEKEFDAIFAVYQDVEAFNIIRKEKKLKKDEKIIEKSLKQKQLEYEQDYENIEKKDFDIFGNVLEDKTKIKTLQNQKHREIAKDRYKVLNINLQTTVDEYMDNIYHYEKILEDAYLRMVSPYDIKVYKANNTEIKDKNWAILNMDAKSEIQNYCNEKEESFVLNCINIKENMPVVFYSNIMFYENYNKTLPEGMNVSQKVLLDLSQYELKLVGRKDFNINFMKNEIENEIKKVQVYEYDIERGNQE